MIFVVELMDDHVILDVQTYVVAPQIGLFGDLVFMAHLDFLR